MISLVYSDRSCIGNMPGLASKKVMGLLVRHRGRRDKRSMLKTSVHFALIKSLKMLGFVWNVSVLKDGERKEPNLESCWFWVLVFFFLPNSITRTRITKDKKLVFPSL